MKKFILITGGAGFIGKNLIGKLIKKNKHHIISLDNYSTGLKNNHINNKRIKYIKGDTNDIEKILKKYRKQLSCVFHFGEFSRIHQSFYLTNQCFKSNVQGTFEVFKFCQKYNLRLIYSATSAAIGNKGEDANLSPYAFTKSKNIDLLFNLKSWFNFKFDIIYFYNVYGPDQIRNGFMATVVGIFEKQYLKKIPLTVVKPGNQRRKFTHIDDTIDACIKVLENKKYKQYSVSYKKSYSILQIAKFFNSKIRFIPSRKGERYKSSFVKKINHRKLINIKAKKDIKDYILNFIEYR